jgi:hypothetical protein
MKMIRESIWMLRRSVRSLVRAIVTTREDWRAWRRFWNSYRRYKALAPAEQKPMVKHLYPCLKDDLSSTPIEPTYFYQDAWAFQRIATRMPQRHVDIGSHHKFVALLSAVVPVTMVDLRPWSLSLETVDFRQGSILDLPFEDCSVVSLSSLCVVEHVGLGRYGDALDPLGSEKAIEELKRVLQPEGHLYISVPMGDENIVAFNAGRIFTMDLFLKIVYPLEIVDMRFVVDRSFQTAYESRPMFGTTGLFELRKHHGGQRKSKYAC